MTANLMVYLMKEYEMEQMTAANVINVWYGATNVFPLIGAFIADAYVGKYLTVVLASFATLLVSTHYYYSYLLRLLPLFPIPINYLIGFGLYANIN